MNAKIKKVIREIDLTEQKVSEFQDKLKQLNQEKIELENLEIIAMFRGYKVSSYDIENVMNKFKEYHESDTNEPKPLPTITSGVKFDMEDMENEED